MPSASSWWTIQTSTTTAVPRWVPAVCPHQQGDPRAKLSFPTCAIAQAQWEMLPALCSQVPGPLTQEMEAKKLEKKRAQKAQRKQREQAQREEQQRREQEQENKQRFAALSDREKVMIGKGI